MMKLALNIILFKNQNIANPTLKKEIYAFVFYFH